MIVLYVLFLNLFGPFGRDRMFSPQMFLNVGIDK